MASLGLISLLFFFSSFLTCIQSSEISFQIHSFNDLRQWPSLLNKGSTWLKVDGHHMLSDFCTKQDTSTSRVKNNEDGCLLLNHDPPVLNRSTPYNTTDDVISFMTDPEYISYFKDPSRPVYIAFCFKYSEFATDKSSIFPPLIGSGAGSGLSLVSSSPCDGSEIAQNFTRLVSRLYSDFISAVSKNNLNVQFILDGAATPNDERICLKDLWRPAIATYIALSDPLQACFDDNVTAGHDRFAINNMQEDTINVVKNTFKYGKFVNSSYPYLLWEPSDQPRIWSALASYTSGPRHEPGFRFAINLDPVQFSIYAANYTQDAWNVPLQEISIHEKSASSLLNTDSLSAPRVVFLPPYIYLLYSNSNSSNFLSIYTYDTLFTSSPRLITAPVLFQSCINSSITSFETVAYHDKPILFVACEDGSVDFFMINDDHTLNLFDSWPNNGPHSTIHNSTFTGLFAVNQDGVTSGSLFIQSYTSVEENGIFLQVYMIGGDLPRQKIGSPLQIFNDRQHSFISMTTIPMNSDPSIQKLISSICPVDYTLLLATMADTSSHIWLNGVCVGLAGLQPLIPTVAPFIIAPGTRPVIKTTGSLIGVSLSNSHCSNNEVINKRPEPALCDTPFTSTPYILGYGLGTLSSWIDMIIKQIPLSACPRLNGVLYGVYDQGNEADMVFQVDDKNQHIFLAVHKGIVTSTNPSRSSSNSNSISLSVGDDQCGLPNSYDGIVLDAFKVNLF